MGTQKPPAGLMIQREKCTAAKIPEHRDKSFSEVFHIKYYVSKNNKG